MGEENFQFGLAAKCLLISSLLFWRRVEDEPQLSRSIDMKYPLNFGLKMAR